MNAPIRLLVIASLLATGCQTAHQDPTAMIYDAQISPDLKKEADYSGEIIVGPDKKKAPINITWSTGRDDSGCLRIIAIQAKRTGGDPSILVSSAKHTFIPDCVMELESNDDQKFQIASISLDYNTSIGIKKYSSSGTVATIQGNGKFTAHNK